MTRHDQGRLHAAGMPGTASDPRRSHGGKSTIDHEFGASHELRLVGREIKDPAGDVIGLSHTSDRLKAIVDNPSGSFIGIVATPNNSVSVRGASLNAVVNR